MIGFSLALLIYCISLTAQQAPTELPKCESFGQKVNLAMCISLVSEFKYYTPEHRIGKSNTDAIRNMTILCDRGTRCLAGNKCQESYTFKKELEESCELLYYSHDHKHCITGFFEEAYLSKESTCFKKYDFFEKFVNDISIKPNDTDGRNAHNVLNEFICNAINKKFQKANQELSKVQLEPNDTRVAKTIKMCKDVQDCISDSSIIQHRTKQTVERTCSILEMMNQGSFYACYSKLMREKPDVSDYECFEGLDFYEMSFENSCKKATTKRECVKKIMEDKCGKDAVVDYDKILERLLQLLDCK